MMKSSSYALRLAASASLAMSAVAILASSPAHAQSQQPAASQQNAYEGVSQPPTDDAIVATPDAPPAAPAPKPSAGVPAAAPAYASSNGTQATRPLSATDDPNSPDYGIVTSVPSQQAERPADAAVGTPADTQQRSGVRLVARPENPDYGIVNVVNSPSSQLAEGTNIRVRMLENLSTTTTHSGTSFRAQVAHDVYKEGRVVIPVGSELRGRVVGVTQGHRVGTPATLRLRPDMIMLPDGTAYHLYAQAIHTDEPHAKTDREGGLQTGSRVTKDLVEYGGAAGGGAIVGAALGGPLGAGVGALTGAGIVTAHLLLQHPQQLKVQQGAEVTFSLTEPMDLVPTRN